MFKKALGFGQLFSFESAFRLWIQLWASNDTNNLKCDWILSRKVFFRPPNSIFVWKCKAIRMSMHCTTLGNFFIGGHSKLNAFFTLYETYKWN